MKTKEEILKENITGYRGSITKKNAIRAMQAYADQSTLEWRNMVDELRQDNYDLKRQLAEKEERIKELKNELDEIKRIYYLINNGDLNQEGYTMYHSIGRILKIN